MVDFADAGVVLLVVPRPLGTLPPVDALVERDGLGSLGAALGQVVGLGYTRKFRPYRDYIHGGGGPGVYTRKFRV